MLMEVWVYMQHLLTFAAASRVWNINGFPISAFLAALFNCFLDWGQTRLIPNYAAEYDHIVFSKIAIFRQLEIIKSLSRLTANWHFHRKGRRNQLSMHLMRGWSVTQIPLCVLVKLENILHFRTAVGWLPVFKVEAVNWRKWCMRISEQTCFEFVRF